MDSSTSEAPAQIIGGLPSWFPDDPMARALLGYTRYKLNSMCTKTWMLVLGHVQASVTDQIDFLPDMGKAGDHIKKFYPRAWSNNDHALFKKNVVICSTRERYQKRASDKSTDIVVLANSSFWVVLEIDGEMIRFLCHEVKLSNSGSDPENVKFSRLLEQYPMVAPLILQSLVYQTHQASGFYENRAARFERTRVSLESILGKIDA